MVITRHGDVDLSHHQAGEQLTALMGTSSEVFAALPVETHF